MSSEWEHLTVGELVRMGEAIVQTGPFGSQLHKHDYTDEGVPVIPTEAIGRGRILDIDVPKISRKKADELARHQLFLGDILFARRGAQATGLSAIVDSRYVGALCGTGALLLRVNSERVDPSYLSMFLSSTHAFEWLRMHAVGAVMPNLNTDIIKALPITLPSLSEQRELAAFHSILSNRITLLRETNTTLEGIVKALFKSWFVDFDPVLAKVEGLEPIGMDMATAAFFPDSFDESDIGLVPKGWSFGKLADLASLNPESWVAKNRPASVAYVDLANAKENVIGEVTEYLFKDAPSRARRVLRDGDTIVGTVRPGNRSFAFIANAEENLTGSTGFAVLRPVCEESSEFIYLVATSDTNIEYLTHIADGGAYPAVRPEVVSSLQCILPSSDVMRFFHGISAPVFKKIASNNRQAKALSQLRDTLLPRLISGELRLPEAEAVTENALLWSV